MKHDQFQAVNYSAFRDVINSSAGRKIANSGNTTLLYDRNNKVLAMLSAAGIGRSGECLPPRYYIRQCA